MNEVPKQTKIIIFPINKLLSKEKNCPLNIFWSYKELSLLIKISSPKLQRAPLTLDQFVHVPIQIDVFIIGYQITTFLHIGLFPG